MVQRKTLLSLLLGVVATGIGLVLALVHGGAAATSVLLDPGAVVRWGLPATKALNNISIGVTIGGLIMAVWALSPKWKSAYNRSLNIAAVAAALWTISGALSTILTYISLDPDSWGSETFGARLWLFLTQVQVGQLALWSICIAAVVTVLTAGVRGQIGVLFVLLAAFAGLIPLASAGHAAGTAGHNLAVSAMLLHLGGASIWIGGLVVLAAVSPKLGRHLQAVTERYSSLALVSFLLVAFSGVANAVLRVGTWDQLFSTAYGQIVIWKAIGLILLGAAGAVNRLRLIRRLNASETAKRAFGWIVTCEFALMGMVSGFSAALGRTATPIPQQLSSDPTPAELLTGEPVPPEPTWLTYITVWRIDPIWLVVCAFALVLYFIGAWRLHRRGDRWPWHRTLLWSIGVLFLFWATNGAFNLYQTYLFSVHMTMHMMLTMLIPLFLVLGAPVTLCMRAITRRTDGSRGGREWILWAVHSPWGQFVAGPVVAAFIFAFSLVVFYYTPLFGWATRDHLGHQWMIVHFLISGYLFVQSLIGIDPGPNRPPYPVRLLFLVVTMAFHAFFGIFMMMGTGLQEADWYGAMGRTWGDSAIRDQQIGGAIAWGLGEFPTIVLALLVGLLWSRSDAKERRRSDRNAARTDEAELNAYNEMLAGLRHPVSDEPDKSADEASAEAESSKGSRA